MDIEGVDTEVRRYPSSFSPFTMKDSFWFFFCFSPSRFTPLCVHYIFKITIPYLIPPS